MNKAESQLFSLIRSAVGDYSIAGLLLTEKYDWQAILKLAMAHGVHGLVFDAIEKLPAESRPEPAFLMQTFGYVSRLEAQAERRQMVASKLAELWAKDGIEAVVLKGSSIAQYYPVPKHRYSCDLDVFIEDGWEKACSILEGQGIALEREVYKEVEFTLDQIYVECHRYITPVRGHKNLQNFEKYIRALLKDSTEYFSDVRLINPPLMFTAMLYIEHALGDFVHGKLTLKHLVDWMVLRQQDIDWAEFHARCDEFKFTRFLKLVNALADVIDGKVEYDALPSSYRRALNEVLTLAPANPVHKSWFRSRVKLFFDILKNNRKFRQFGYCSMPNYLFNSVWTHFFRKEVMI